MHRSGCTVLCSVRSWAAVCRRVISYSDTDENTPVNTIFVDAKLSTISSTTVRDKLRSVADGVREDMLSFESDDIGTHSVRSGAGMAMYLAGVPTFSIMMIGRWFSDSFLKYIRKKVKQFSDNISSRMLQNESYFTTPDFDPTISRHDTRIPNDHRSFATRHNSGVTVPWDPFEICV